MKAKGEGIKGAKNLLTLPPPRQTTAHPHFFVLLLQYTFLFPCSFLTVLYGSHSNFCDI